MTRKQKRLWMVVAGVLLAGAAAGLALTAFRDNVVFFLSPAEAVAKHVEPGRTFRMGGLVENGSVKKSADGLTTEFVITDLTASIPATYTGLLPDLFREGQGVVALGKLENGRFVASEVLAKHDEKYMPPEVAAALKKSGRWQEGGAK